VSHNPAEYSSPEHLAAGTQVLADVMLELAA
jgi:acetylornithine deacetylase/succinyl-diaminopimelate desuccinylase-like protein